MQEGTFEFGHADGGVTAADGFLTAGVSAGLKRSGKRDVCVIAATAPCSAAGVFTTSATAAPPVLVSREHLSAGTLRAVVVNAGNANACTGGPGMADARTMADAPEIDGVVQVQNGLEAGLQPGDFVDVEIMGSDEHDLYGEAVPALHVLR